ncbi:MAG: hypothetical protein E4G99_12480 [Anaerolineales bacterium]|nr:MAG: hypothetical protein E4G99_12480 [Anaerolineales bacterium]
MRRKPGKKHTIWIDLAVGGFLAIGLVTGAAIVFTCSEAAAQRLPYAASTGRSGLSAGWLSEGNQPIDRKETALERAGPVMRGLGMTLGVP